MTEEIDEKQLISELKTTEIELSNLIVKNKEIRSDLKKSREVTPIQDLEVIFKEISESDTIEVNTFSIGQGSELVSISEAEKILYEKQLNEIIKEEFQPMLNQSNNLKIIEINIIFEGDRVTYSIEHESTFEDLALKVAKYLGLPEERIFFSNIEPDDENSFPPIYLRKTKIIDEIYVWDKIRLNSHFETLYVVMRNYQSINEIYKEIEPGEPDERKKTLIEEELDFLHRDKKPEVSSSEIMKKRSRMEFIYNASHSIAAVMLMVMWIWGITEEKNIFNSSWMTKVCHNVFFYDFIQEEPGDLYRPYTEKYVDVISEVEFWNYIDSIQDTLFVESYLNERPYGYLSEQIIVFPNAEIRQLRSNMETCYLEIGNYECPTSYSDEPSTEDFGVEEGFIYEENDSIFFLTGNADYYGLDGFSTELNTENITVWSQIVNTLKSLNWIDNQTRMIALTWNIINPNIKNAIVIVNFLEISYHGYWTNNYEILSFKYEYESLDFSVRHALIMFLIILILVLEIRNLLLTEEELMYHETKNIPAMRMQLDSDSKLLEKWEAHSKKKFFKRLRKPKSFEIITEASLVVALIIEINVFYWNIVEKELLEVETGEYVDIYSVARYLMLIYDLRFLMIIALSASVCRFMMFWIKSVAEFYSMLKLVLAELWMIIVLVYLVNGIFLTAFFYLLGPFTEHHSEVYSALITTMGLFGGNWSLDDETFYMANKWNFVFLILVFRMMVYFTILVFGCHYFSQLKECRHTPEVYQEVKRGYR